MRDRNGLLVLDEEACLDRLRGVAIGRVAFPLAGHTLVLPVTFALDGRTGIVFRTGRGSKLSRAEREVGDVAFEADDFDRATRTGWSVLVRGEMDEVLELTEIARLEGLPLHPWADEVSRPRWIRIAIERISGREIVRAV